MHIPTYKDDATQTCQKINLWTNNIKKKHSGNRSQAKWKQKVNTAVVTQDVIGYGDRFICKLKLWSDTH